MVYAHKDKEIGKRGNHKILVLESRQINNKLVFSIVI